MIYVIILPVLIGLIALIMFRWHFLLNEIRSTKKIFIKTILVVLYLTQGLLASYLSFGLASNMIWNYFNKKEAHKQPNEYFYCEITNFPKHRRNSLVFKFNNKYEFMRASYRVIGNYWNEDPRKYRLRLLCRKGIWNYYIVDAYDILNKTGILNEAE